jgi:hypothetical protein
MFINLFLSSRIIDLLPPIGEDRRGMDTGTSFYIDSATLPPSTSRHTTANLAFDAGPGREKRDVEVATALSFLPQ